MRGRWASAALGAGIARSRAAGDMQAQEAAHQQEIARLKAEQQKELEHMKEVQNAKQSKQSSGKEDVTQKLQKLADLKKQGVLSDEEFQKLKTELLAKL